MGFTGNLDKKIKGSEKHELFAVQFGKKAIDHLMNYTLSQGPN